MIYFTKYAEQKFDILHKYKVFLTREQIEEVVNLPDQVKKKGGYLAARKDDIKVVYRKENDTIKIATFYPVKQ